MSKDKPMPERRKSVRFHVLSLMKHASDTNTAVFSVTNIQNISRGGLAFFTDEKIPEGTVLKLYFLPPNRKTPVEAKGKTVRRSRSKRNKKAFKVGVQFLEISEDAKQAIQELETSFLAKQQEN